MKRVVFIGMAVVIVFLALHVRVMSQQLATIRDIYNKVWDKANARLMTTPWAGAQQAIETETTILNNVWDKPNNMLRTSGAAGSGMTNPMTTAGDMIVGGASGVAQRLALASQAFINVKAPPYSAVGNGVADDTVAIQAALDAAQNINPVGSPNGSGTVQLPPGIYLISSISVPTQVVLQGSNMWNGGSTLRQVNGVNGDAVKLKCRDDDGFYYGGVQHLSVDKALPVTDTVGSGIGVTRTSGTCSLGESAIVRDLHVTGFPVSGIQVLQGSAPLRITHISVFANGQFGIDIRGQHQTVLLDSISGDNNGTALINVDGTGSTYDATMIRISNVKAETNTGSPAPGNPQETVVRLGELTNARVTIESISATAGGGGVFPQELVRIRGERPILTRLVDFACSGCVNIFVDERNSFTLPWTHAVKEFFYKEDGTYQFEGRNGYTLETLALGNNIAAQPAGSLGGTLTQKGVQNGMVLQTLTRSTDTAPTGSFVRYQSVAAVDLWSVDVSGSLTAGNIPVGRLNNGTGADATTFWRGDGTWAVPAGGGGGSGDIDAVGSCLTAACFTAASPSASLTFNNATSGTATLQTVTGALGTAVVSLPAASDTLVGKATSDTLTNKTLDVESTGNVFTSKHKMWMPAASCVDGTAGFMWDVMTGQALTVVCITGESVSKGVVNYPDSAFSYLQVTLMLPDDWVGIIEGRLVWQSAATSGSVVWDMQIGCTADDEVDDNVFNAPVQVVDATKAIAQRMNFASLGTLTATNCAAGEMLHVALGRDGANVSDTLTGSAGLVGLELTIRRAQ